jgi:hypothetical protein
MPHSQRTQEEKCANARANKRSYNRSKAIKRGEPIPPEVAKQKAGRKVSMNVTVKGDEKRQVRRVQYRKSRTCRIIHCGQDRGQVHRLSITLRQRRKARVQGVVSAGKNKIEEMSDLIKSNFSTLLEGKETMARILREIELNFTWMKTNDGLPMLFFVQTIRGDMILHPWVEVKKSVVTDTEKDGGFSYGLYASRRFEEEDAIGLYVGRVLEGRTERDIESIFKISVGNGLLHVDVEIEGRLTYGLGMHMMNDKHYPEKPDRVEGSLNNALISGELCVYAMKSIEKGEEITTCYNYNK